MRHLLTPRWILSHLFVVAMVVVMVNLGFWQLHRLDERKARNDEVRAALESDPVPVEDLLTTDGVDHRPVVVRGTYRDEASFLVANRSLDGQAGSWLATPVALADGRVVVVARGWVPRTWTAGDDPREIVTPSGPVEIAGRLFDTVGGGRIGTADVSILPEISRMDLDRVEEVTGLAVEDRWVQLDRQIPPLGDLPIPVPPASLDEGPHLSYAFQWFFFSTATVIVYALILRRRLHEPVS